MIGDLALHLGAPEACPKSGIYVTKTYVGVMGSRPRPLKPVEIGNRQPDRERLGALTMKILEFVPPDARNRVVGYSILKLCTDGHSLRLERFGNFAFAKPKAAWLPVEALHNTDGDGVGKAKIDYPGAGSIDNCVDFPTTQAEKGYAESLNVVEALVAAPLMNANIVVRQSLHLMTDADLRQ
jgi:hypothetical protein